MTHIQSIPAPAIGPAPKIRTIGAADLNWALAEGWKDFKAKRGDLILLALIYPLVAFLAAAISFNGRLLPMFFPLVAGLSILGPAVACGFYELARRREAGVDASWWHFVDPLQGRSRFGLAVLTGGLLVLFVFWLAAASMIYAATMGDVPFISAADFLSRLFTTPEGWAMIVLGNLMGGVFAVATLVLALVSFPMVVDKAVDPVTAVAASIHAASINPAVVTRWGLTVAGLLLLGCLPAFLGLAVVLPVLGYASWHLYTRLVER